MRKLSLYIVMCCFALPLWSQTDTLLQNSGLKLGTPISIHNGKAKSFSADNLGNVYVLTAGGLLIKYNDNGDSLNVFNDVRRYGNISALDATNPMKLLLYYKDFSTIVMLDRYLNRINLIDLRKFGVFQAKAVGLAYDNNIWVFDEQSAKLKKIDETGRLLSETADLRQVLETSPSPDKIIDRDGFVYVYDIVNGLFIFDYYGTLKNSIVLKGLRDLQITGKMITGRRNQEIITYIPGSLELVEVPLPATIQQSEKIYISQSGIFVLDEGGVKLYPFIKEQ